MSITIGLIYSKLFKGAPILEGETIYGVEYKEGLTLDIYLPLERVYDQIPVVVFFHGGAWVVGRKESINVDRYHGAVNSLRTLGYAVVSTTYTLGRKDRPPFPACIVDAYDVVNWVGKNHREYNFDPNNVGVFGESAGAHIALMAAYAQPELFSAKLDNVKIDYVVDVYGPNDLKTLYEIQALDSTKGLLAKLPDPLRNKIDIESYILGFDPQADSLQTQEFFELYSPVTYINAQTVPTLMIHGDVDILVPVGQTMELKNKLEANSNDFEVHILEGVNHAFIGVSGEQYDDVQQWIPDFISRQYNEQ